jgi:hypothetical protein
MRVRMSLSSSPLGCVFDAAPLDGGIDWIDLGGGAPPDEHPSVSTHKSIDV